MSFKKALLLCFLLLFLFYMMAFSAQEVQTATQIVEKFGKAVVLIATAREGQGTVGIGTGFIVTSSGVIVTNYHVIAGAYPAIIKLTNGDIYDDISIIDVDERRDIAIIKIKGWDLPIVELGNSELIKTGEQVVVIGNPQGLENTVTDGLVSGKRDMEAGYRLHQISAPISPGSSGSPVFNRRGEVIGIATSSIVEGQNLNFSVPINYARGLISEDVKMSLQEFSGKSEEPPTKKTAPDNRSAHAEAYTQQGISLFESEQFAEAALAFQEALKAVPEDITLNFKLALSYQKSGQYDKAEQVYLMLAEISPKDLAAYHNTIVLMYDEAKLSEKAVAAATQLVEIDPNNAEAHFNLGYMLIKKKNFAEAANVFKKVIELDPNMEYAYLQLGYCHSQLKQFQSAVGVYEKLAAIVPENADAWSGVGHSNMLLKKWDSAVEPFKKVIALKPDNGSAYYNLGICYLNLKDNFSARKIWKKLRTVDQGLANKLRGFMK